MEPITSALGIRFCNTYPVQVMYSKFHFCITITTTSGQEHLLIFLIYLLFYLFKYNLFSIKSKLISNWTYCILMLHFFHTWITAWQTSETILDMIQETYKVMLRFTSCQKASLFFESLASLNLMSSLSILGSIKRYSLSTSDSDILQIFCDCHDFPILKYIHKLLLLFVFLF
jgi:hypothetical protein